MAGTRRRPQDAAARVAALADDVRAGRGRALVVEGPPGPARSAAVAGALTGVDIVRATGDPDAGLVPFAALGDAVRPLAAHLDGLPPAQAAALRGVLGLGPPAGDHLAVAAGFVALLRSAGSYTPVVLVVDGADALDDATAATVAYAARRLGGGHAGAVIAQDGAAATRLALSGLERVAVGDEPAPPPAACRRGLHATEAALHEQAGRWVAAGAAWLAAGDLARASACAAHAAGADPAGALLLEGRIATVAGRGRAAREALSQAADTAEDAGDAGTAAVAMLLSVPLALHTGGLGEAAALLERARALVEPTGDAAASRLLAVTATAVDLAAGRPADHAPLLELIDGGLTEPGVAEAPVLVTTVALPLVWSERYAAARHLLERTIAVARQRSATGALPLPLGALAVLERREGHLDAAAAAAEEARRLAATTGQRFAELFALAELAQVHAQQGDIEGCRAAAGSVLAAVHSGSTIAASARSALATLELWLGNVDAVIDLLEPVVASSIGTLSPAVTMYHQNLIAAYALAGRHDDARRLLPALEHGGARQQAVLERCHGLLAPTGEYDAHFERAVAQSPNAFGRGLSLLFWAARQAADGRHADAAATLSEVLSSHDPSYTGIRRAAQALVARLHGPGSEPGGSNPRAIHAPVVRLLGGLAVERAGVATAPPAGAPAVTLAAVALRGSVHVEELGDLLWPDADPALARRRLRNVLTRVRQSVGEVLVRRGDAVVLADGVEVDARIVESAAAEVTAGTAPAATVRRALRLLRGPLLPTFAYEEWTAEDRRRMDVIETRLREAADVAGEDSATGR